LKNVVKVPSKSNPHPDRDPAPNPDPDLSVRGMDPGIGIRIHNKMSWIGNTGSGDDDVTLGVLMGLING
jgi:hypothetical protein